MSTTRKEDRFTAAWEPRIGEAATRTMRINTWLSLSWVLAGVLAFLSSFAWGTSLWMLGIVCILGILLIGFMWLKTRLRLAREMTVYLGFPVRWNSISHGSHEKFDAWVAKNQQQYHQRSE